MRNFNFPRRGLFLALAAVMAVAQAASAASMSSTMKLVSAQLPGGVTLARANCEQTAEAVRSAVAQRPDLATSITQVGVLARTPKQGQGTLSCDCLLKIVRGAINSAPSSSSEIVQMALSLHPECSDELNKLLTNGPDGYNTPSDAYLGFGVGFGPGFPGSPGFIGSPPSGAIALPPVIAVTSDVNG